MDFLQRFNTQNEERDRIFRVVQYSTHLLWALQEMVKDDPKQTRHLKEIEATINRSRQMLRFGRSVESLNLSLYSMHLQDNLLRTTITLSQISNSLYLFCDNFLWLSRVGIIKANEARLSKLANSYWLYSIILSLVKNLYQMQIIFRNRPVPIEDFNSLRTKEHRITPRYFFEFACYNKNLTMEITKNLCDICLCLDSLSKVDISPFKIGLIGVISSLIPIIKQKSLNY